MERKYSTHKHINMQLCRLRTLTDTMATFISLTLEAGWWCGGWYASLTIREGSAATNYGPKADTLYTAMTRFQWSAIEYTTVIDSSPFIDVWRDWRSMRIFSCGSI